MSLEQLPEDAPRPEASAAPPAETGGTQPEASGENPESPAQAQPAKGKEKKPKGPDYLGNIAYCWLQAAIVSLSVLLILFTFVGRVVAVDGHSMDPTLNNQDLLLVVSIGYEPKQGDVVVLKKAFLDIDQPIVKRVIAVGGQTVFIDYSSSTVYVDGVALEEDYIYEAMQPTSDGQTYWEIPEGSVFVMGDNRNHSTDSRNPNLGIIDERYILGHAVYTLLPLQHTGPVA